MDAGIEEDTMEGVGIGDIMPSRMAVVCALVAGDFSNSNGAFGPLWFIIGNGSGTARGIPQVQRNVKRVSESASTARREGVSKEGIADEFGGAGSRGQGVVSGRWYIDYDMLVIFL